MDKRIRVCIWATTFQADIFTFTRYLCAHEDYEVIVAMDDIEKFKNEPVWQLMPVECRMLDKSDKKTIKTLRSFAPHVTIIDNHPPPKKFSPYLFNIWHSWGWKGPQDKKEFKHVFKLIKSLTGHRGDRPNPYYRWNCMGPSDFEHREKVSGLAADNLLALGSPFVDDILAAPFSKEALLDYYPAGFAGRKVVLIALTWHFGRALAHWGDDIGLFTRLLEKLEAMGCAAIVRMHDRNRFEADYIDELEMLTGRFPAAMIKYKDENRDNLLDILVSDVMISNYSGILLYQYATGRPSIHIYPVDSSREFHMYRVLKRGKIRTLETDDKDYIWKLSPEENGGLQVSSFDELEAAIDLAVAKPDCCRDRTRAFVEKHMTDYDGKACHRLEQALRDLVKKS